MWFLAYFILHLIAYTLIRLEFLIWNHASLRVLTAGDLVRAFLNGIRFDLSALAATVGLGLLFLPALGRWPRLRQGWLWLFIALNAAFILLNCADAELFNFTAKRFSASSFFLIGEGSVGNLLWPYIPLASFTLGLAGAYIYLAHRITRRFPAALGWRRGLVMAFTVLVLGVLFSRGGLQHKPLTFVDAKLFNNSYANNLVLNSTFTIIKSISKPPLTRMHYFADQQQMLELLNAQNLPAVPLKAEKMNVVLVILESFSREYLELQDPAVTPYLNRLRGGAGAVDFGRAYANGRRSIEGIAAILSGIPALMEEPFINSEFSANQVIGLGTLLSAHGYHTSFFHGAENGSMHFDRFTKSVGVENYFGKSEYPDPHDDDGTWGIYDEPFLQWACRKYGEFPQPFFSSIFTLSSHQPYNLPESYRGKFTDDRLPILKTVRYTDYAVEQFMRCAELQPWYRNTLFIFTADHTGPELHENTAFAGRYRVPLILFSPDPARLRGLDAGQFAQHIDLLPTVLDLLNIEYKNRNYLARSLLRPGPKVIALYSDGQYELVGDVQDREKQLRAIQQYFSEGLYDNRLYYPSK